MTEISSRLIAGTQPMTWHGTSSRAVLIAIACLLSVGRATSQDADTPGSAIAITQVDLIPMDRERLIPDQTVIVENGRIVSIGPADAADVPEAVSLVIEGRDKYLMPGLADMHVHLSNYGIADPNALALLLANGVTTVRNMHGSPEILDWRARIEERDLVGPRIYTTGPILDGDPPLWPSSTVVRTPEEAEQAVEEQKKAGYDAIKILGNISPEAYAAVLTSAARHEMPVFGHVPTRVAMENALKSSQRSFEHASDLIAAILPEDSSARAHLVEIWAGRSKMSWRGMFLDPYEQADRDKIPGLVANAAEGGAWFCPTLAVHRIYQASATEYEQIRSNPTTRYVSPQTLSSWGWLAEYLSTDEHSDPAIMRRGFETMLLVVEALHDAGVPLVAGTDAPSPFVVPGFSVHQELEIFVEAGLTPFEALAAATRDAAELVGASGEWGRVVVGHRADLVLVKGNPLEDVRHVSKPEGVMANGRWFSGEDLDAMLEDVARGYRNAATEASAPEGGGE